jgi:hypothetical protein
LWEDSSYGKNWQSMYDNFRIIATQTKDVLILNGNDILSEKVFNDIDLKFDMVLLIYPLSMLHID